MESTSINELDEGQESVSTPFSSNARLECMNCGAIESMGTYGAGCKTCDLDPASPFEVVYHDVVSQGMTIQHAVNHLRKFRQPLRDGLPIALGRVDSTPLVSLPAFGLNLWAKNETVNPTWSHKDRAHTISVAVAKAIGAKGVVTATTGNHGASAAAHAAKAGLPSVIFCRSGASETAITMIRAYGGVVAQLPYEITRTNIGYLVDNGWYPATSMDPALSSRANPYGAEGYKAISYEIAESLGRLPAIVIIPVASGDTLYGITKGFAELAELTDKDMPIVFGVQPVGAAPLVMSEKAGKAVRIENPSSRAISIAEPLTGRPALQAIQRWGGSSVAVSEDAISLACADLAHQGLLVEPASAASLAGYRTLISEGRLSAMTGPVVTLLTNAGPKWPGELAELFDGRSIRTEAELRELADSL